MFEDSTSAQPDGKAAYEPPALVVLGTFHELTQTGGSWPCLWKKTIGPPDYVNWIPISNCSA